MATIEFGNALFYKNVVIWQQNDRGKEGDTEFFYSIDFLCLVAEIRWLGTVQIFLANIRRIGIYN